MNKRRQQRQPAKPAPPPGKSTSQRKNPIWPVSLAIVGIATAVIIGVANRSTPKQSDAASPYVPRSPGTLNFSQDIAPIVFERCADCHRPGQAAPFTLLNYADVKKRAKQIAEVTARRYMPPWLPEPGCGEFADARSLTAGQLGMLQQWVAEGAIEGNSADLPPLPKWSVDWQLGTPDLVVKMTQPYPLAAEGKDVYRNLVIPISVPTRRYVKAVEFQPGNAKVVHHAFINLDPTRASRHLAEKENPAGFDGMQLPETAVMVAGQMLGWQPGKRPEVTGEGLSWALDKNTDLVLQLHLHPTGRPELVQSAVGFYFTDQAPTNTPFRLYLPQWRIDIPAGAKDYSVENSYVLPVDVEVLRVSPHAHYLGKELQGYAILPDGKKEWLVRIKDWDFNWQGDFRYAKPVFLPKGSKVVMQFTYDNSTNNVRNPNQPPKRVRYGLQTTDEMAEMCYQVLTRNEQDLAALRADYFKKMTLDVIDFNKSVLSDNPNNAGAHAKLGQALLPLGRWAEAVEHLRAAIRLNPSDDKAHYDLGSLHLLHNQLAEALPEFETVLRLNPDDYQAHGSLGSVYLRLRNLDLAEKYFASALRLNPEDPVAKRNLELVLAARRDRRAANRPGIAGRRIRGKFGNGYSVPR